MTLPKTKTNGMRLVTIATAVLHDEDDMDEVVKHINAKADEYEAGGGKTQIEWLVDQDRITIVLKGKSHGKTQTEE